MIAEIEQQIIPGLEEYTDRVAAIKGAIGQSMISMGGVLWEAREAMTGYSPIYWENWLRTIDVKPRAAELAIIAYQVCGDLPQQIPDRTLKAIVSAPPEARVKALELLSQGRSIKYQEIAQIVRESKAISVGKTVYLQEDSPIPGAQGIVKSVDRETVVVEVNGAIVTCFMGELSLSPPSQLSIAIAPRKSPAENLNYTIRSLQDENLLLRATILSLWLQPTGDIRSRIEEEYPHVKEWAGGGRG